MMIALFRRILYDMLLFLSIFFFPWWIPVALLVFGTLLFSEYYEALLAGLFLDTLYGERGAFVLSSLRFSFFAVLSLLLSFPIRERFTIRRFL